MKISINLYDDELRPKKHLLTLNNIAIAASVGVAVMLIWFGSLWFKTSELANKQEQLDQEKHFAEQELSNLQKALVKHNDSGSLNQQKEKLERQIQAKKVLLKLVSSRSSEEAVDYYQVMKDLTEHHDHDVWLSHFKFNQNDVLFDGFATQSKSVTQWLTYLQATDSFKGREFTLLDIQAVETEYLQFQTATSIALTAVEEEQ